MRTRVGARQRGGGANCATTIKWGQKKEKEEVAMAENETERERK